MHEVVTWERRGATGLITLNNPPVNAAGAALRAGLVRALDALLADPDVSVIALYGEGRSFIAGADIREFGKPPAEPLLPEVCNRLENSTKPVLCVLHGAALGGGLEVAMATHARIAIEGVALGLPEVTLGIIPGAGGTQRMPRLTGVATALDLITTGRRIDAETAHRLGLVDRVVTGSPIDAALTAAQQVLDGTLPARRSCNLRTEPNPAAIARTRETLNRTQAHLFSPHRAIDAMEAAILPLPEGLQRERALFQECMNSPQRTGLIHAFFAERAVAKIPEAAATPRKVTQVGVIGAGTMGSGIASAFLLAGLPVVLIERADNVLEKGAAAIASNLDGAVRRGKMTETARAAVNLQTSTDMATLAPCDLIVEAAFEDMNVKRQIFESLGKITKIGTVLATNTSYLDINEIARASGRPADVIGLHFFSPAHVMKLLEVVVGDATAPDAVATGFALAKRMRKIAVRAGVCDGFIGNRIMSAYRKACDFMLIDGTPVDRIDAAIRTFGFAIGPFEMSDLAGLDIGWAARKRLAQWRDPDTRYHGAVADRLCEAGQFGRKTGRGYYDHSGAVPIPNPDLAAHISEVQTADGITPRGLSDDDIVERCMAAMIAEAARVLDEGVALRPIDIDAVFLFGYGFPRWRGGPMLHADMVGVAAIITAIERFSREDPTFWTVPTCLRSMAAQGVTFATLNGRT